MLNKITVIFDLGGVLIDWNPRYLYRKIFADEAEMEFFLNQVCTPAWNAQMDLDKSFSDAADELKTSFPEYTTQIQIWYDRWDEMIGGPITGTVEILEEIKQTGYPLAALSNWSAETFPIAYKKYDFLSWFTPVVISGEVGLVKPDPKIFHLLLQEINRDPDDCIFIDDTQENIQIAQELGFEGILFSSPLQLRDQLEHLGVLQNGRG